jgi:hypothetical protein
VPIHTDLLVLGAYYDLAVGKLKDEMFQVCKLSFLSLLFSFPPS